MVRQKQTESERQRQRDEAWEKAWVGWRRRIRLATVSSV